MFYICSKCKRRWEYPLRDCPYCFTGLEKMKNKTAKVAGAVKVAIPTLFHPNVPYYVLLLEDEFGNKWAHKSEREYASGEALEFEPNENAVAIWRVKHDIGEALEKVLELISGISFGADSKIAVIPSLEKASHAYFRDNASPEFLAAILELLLARGARAENIVVGAQSFGDLPTATLAQKSGLLEVCQRLKIAAQDLAEGEFEKIGKFEISKTILGADLVVNLAMQKMGQAAATKNMFSVLKKENYLGQKYLSSEAEMAAELEPRLKNMVVVGEAENVQRTNKLTAFTGLILAGKSARNVDRVFNEIALPFKMPEIIKNFDLPTVVGRSVKEVQYQAEIF